MTVSAENTSINAIATARGILFDIANLLLCYGEAYPKGFTLVPFTRTSKWQCAPVA